MKGEIDLNQIRTHTREREPTGRMEMLRGPLPTCDVGCVPIAGLHVVARHVHPTCVCRAVDAIVI